MRILLISGEYPPMQGGVADYSHILAQRFGQRGHSVGVLTSRDAAGASVFGDEGVTPRAVMARWGWWELTSAARRAAAEIEPDVINIQYQAAAYGMHPAINLLPRLFSLGMAGRVPCVVTFHDLLVPYLFPKAGPVRWWSITELAQSSAHVIVTNTEDYERLSSEHRMPPIHRIPIGSNVTTALPADYDRSAWRSRWDATDDALVLCYFGFLNASKGGEELIEALATLRREGRDVRLVMIGGSLGASDPTNRAYLTRVQQAIEAAHLAPHVTWTGHLSDEEVSASFGASDVTVLPYRDGVSFRRGSLMAALAHGMPIISCRPRAALPEIVHGENIWLVPPEDASALALGIAQLADAHDLRRRLSAGARALSHLFDWDAIADHTLDVFLEAITA